MVNPLNVSGLFEGGKADYLFGSAFFVCYENFYEKVLCGFQEVLLFFLMYS